jgi:hypothetical protein
MYRKRVCACENRGNEEKKKKRKKEREREREREKGERERERERETDAGPWPYEITELPADTSCNRPGVLILYVVDCGWQAVLLPPAWGQLGGTPAAGRSRGK